MTALVEIFKPDFVLHHAVWGSLVVGLACPLAGVYLVLRRHVLWGVALPQVATAGIAAAFWLQSMGVTLLAGADGHDEHLAMAGALLLTSAAVYLLARMERRGRGASDGRLGAIYATAWAASILLVSFNAAGETELLGLLKGEIVSISEEDFHAMLYVYAAASAALLVCRREFTLVSYDRDMAVSLGRKADAWDLGLQLLLALTIALGVMTVGPLVIFGLLVLPPMAALPWSRGMLSLSLLASFFGGLSGLGGFLFSYARDLPLGPTIVAAAAGLLAVSRLARKLIRAS